MSRFYPDSYENDWQDDYWEAERSREEGLAQYRRQQELEDAAYDAYLEHCREEAERDAYEESIDIEWFRDCSLNWFRRGNA